MSKSKVDRIKSITEFHRLHGLPKPEHPLISVIDVESLRNQGDDPEPMIFGFYSIALKRNCSGKVRYGQQQYDFDEGIMVFVAPNQIFGIEQDQDEKSQQPSGWILLIHPDFIWNTTLAKTINHYKYFGYSVNEALFLSEKEETAMIDIIHNIQQEYHAPIDEFSQQIVISQIEVLLNYAERFYHRQFITRKITNHKILDQLEEHLAGYLAKDDLVIKGLPTVQNVAQSLHISPSYLSSLLKRTTGQSTQQHIHNKLIEKAKEELSTTDLTVTEIAYDLGFEHSQSFSRLFKNQTDLSPSEFRNSFN